MKTRSIVAIPAVTQRKSFETTRRNNINPPPKMMKGGIVHVPATVRADKYQMGVQLGFSKYLIQQSALSSAQKRVIP
jgi:hypothetical protein